MSSFPTRNRKFQKIAKQLKKLKTTILATFQANISWERLSSYQTRNRKFQKNSKQIQKFKKQHYGFSSSHNKLGKAEKEREKKKKSFRRVPTRPVIENSKKKVKKFKKLENTIMTSF